MAYMAIYDRTRVSLCSLSLDIFPNTCSNTTLNYYEFIANPSNMVFVLSLQTLDH